MAAPLTGTFFTAGKPTTSLRAQSFGEHRHTRNPDRGEPSLRDRSLPTASGSAISLEVQPFGKFLPINPKAD